MIVFFDWCINTKHSIHMCLSFVTLCIIFALSFTKFSFCFNWNSKSNQMHSFRNEAYNFILSITGLCPLKIVYAKKSMLKIKSAWILPNKNSLQKTEICFWKEWKSDKTNLQSITKMSIRKELLNTDSIDGKNWMDLC